MLYPPVDGASASQRSPNKPGANGGRPPPQEYDTHSLTPVVIRQLLEAQATEPNGFRCDGRELQQLSLVAKIAAMDTTGSPIGLVLDDGTGIITAKLWLDGDATGLMQADLEQCGVLGYARVYGHLKLLHGERVIIAFRVRPCTDPEITHHFLDAIRCHLLAPSLAKGEGSATPPAPVAHRFATASQQQHPAAAAQAGWQGAAPTHHQQQHQQHQQHQQYQQHATAAAATPASAPAAAAVGHNGETGGGAAAAAAAGGGGGGAAFMPQLTYSQTQLVGAIHECCQGETGADLQQVAALLADRGLDILQIQEDLSLLGGLGVIYTTIDDTHVVVAQLPSS